jgi:hypothetical protein
VDGESLADALTVVCCGWRAALAVVCSFVCVFPLAVAAVAAPHERVPTAGLGVEGGRDGE